MSLRKFTPAEAVVFDAIVDQRKDHIGCIFEFDYKKGWEFLNKMNATADYGLEYGDLLKIIFKLAEDGMLKIDYLVNRNFGTKKEPKLEWVFKTDWASDTYQLNGLKSIEDCYADMGTTLVINLTFKDVKKINYSCRPIHKVLLALNQDQLRLYITYVDNKERHCHYFPPFKDGSVPYQIIQYAIKKAGTEVTRDELERAGISVRGRYLKTQVFSDNKTVNDVLNPFIKLTTNTIKITLVAVVSLSELEQLLAEP